MQYVLPTSCQELGQNGENQKWAFAAIFERLFNSMSQVVDIMKTNVEKVLERDQKLSELDDRAGNI